MEDIKDLTLKALQEAIKKFYFVPQERHYTVMTGAGGMDLFEEKMENWAGFGRRYIGKKVPRILRYIKGIVIQKSRSGNYYRRIGKINLVDTE